MPHGKLIDANILLRYLTWDLPEKAEKCKELMKRLEFGQEKALLLDIILAEVIWTLQKFFGMKKTKIRDVLAPILRFKGLNLENKNVVLSALDIYAERNVDFPDAYLSELSKDLKTGVYSYDKDISELGAKQIEP